MRAVVQRVKKASVLVEGKKISKIDSGYLVLLGIHKQDNPEVARHLAKKISQLRIMSDKSGKMSLGLRDVNADLIVVSQFSLYANTQEGNRPSFFQAADKRKAKSLYHNFIDFLEKSGLLVKSGAFGENMHLKVELDGPVTIIYDTETNF